MAGAAQFDFGFKTPPRRRKVRRGRPKKVGAGVPHLRRSLVRRAPLHVTFKMRAHVWQLRSRRCYRVLEQAFRAGCDRFGGRVCEFSVQRDHVHMLVEAEDSRALARSLQGLAIRMARGLNRLMGRRGKVFADRYHARPLRTPTEVRRALVYVLRNARKHLGRFGYAVGAAWVDEFSSGGVIPGWTARVSGGGSGSGSGGGSGDGAACVATPTTWLLARGWRERAGGPLRPDEGPPAAG